MKAKLNKLMRKEIRIDIRKYNLHIIVQTLSGNKKPEATKNNQKQEKANTEFCF